MGGGGIGQEMVQGALQFPSPLSAPQRELSLVNGFTLSHSISLLVYIICISHNKSRQGKGTSKGKVMHSLTALLYFSL